MLVCYGLYLEGDNYQGEISWWMAGADRASLGSSGGCSHKSKCMYSDRLLWTRLSNCIGVLQCPYMCVSGCVCVSLCVPACPSVLRCVSVSICVCVYVCFCISVCMCFCVFLCVCVCALWNVAEICESAQGFTVFLCVSINASKCFKCLWVCFCDSLCFRECLYVCLCVCVSVCSSISLCISKWFWGSASLCLCFSENVPVFPSVPVYISKCL